MQLFSKRCGGLTVHVHLGMTDLGAWLQVLEMHVDGFRFDLGSIFTRAHSQWHDVDAAAAAAGGDEPDEPEAVASAAEAELAKAPTGLRPPQLPPPPPPPAAPGERRPACSSAHPACMCKAGSMCACEHTA